MFFSTALVVVAVAAVVSVAQQGRVSDLSFTSYVSVASNSTTVSFDIHGAGSGWLAPGSLVELVLGELRDDADEDGPRLYVTLEGGSEPTISCYSKWNSEHPHTESLNRTICMQGGRLTGFNVPLTFSAAFDRASETTEIKAWSLDSPGSVPMGCIASANRPIPKGDSMRLWAMLRWANVTAVGNPASITFSPTTAKRTKFVDIPRTDTRTGKNIGSFKNVVFARGATGGRIEEPGNSTQRCTGRASKVIPILKRSRSNSVRPQPLQASSKTGRL
ncbi:hypothetical protein RI367_005581 [Sorochytrium milnesiophthora]